MRTHSRLRAALLALALLALPGAGAMAQDPTDPPVNLCGQVATVNAGPVTIDGETPTTGECAIATGSNLPAWAWLDITLVPVCQQAEGAGTNAVKDGAYFRGITRDASGAIVSQSNITNWSGCTPTGYVVHKQLAMQGYDRTVVLVVERRRWPFGGNQVVSTDTDRPYTGTAAVTCGSCGQ